MLLTDTAFADTFLAISHPATRRAMSASRDANGRRSAGWYVDSIMTVPQSAMP
jgi:hypothetical protein